MGVEFAELISIYGILQAVFPNTSTKFPWPFANSEVLWTTQLGTEVLKPLRCCDPSYLVCMDAHT